MKLFNLRSFSAEFDGLQQQSVLQFSPRVQLMYMETTHVPVSKTRQ